ncbi:hypothetical protein ACQKPE_00805 [Pseudomonas sp. NPDC089554]|uniref:hypothetical protein n=1 Tax=Pseudomonas sp. NPDC089554 TaxID=3390653 RepID=UPI003D058E6B
MIRFDRGPTPDIFASERLAGLRAQAVDFYSQPKAKRAQSRFSFQPVASLLHPPIRALWGERDMHKCAYCEQYLDQMDIDVFRPRQGAIDLKGEVSDDHYWWLAFEWSNYLPSCAECNALKGSRFPVEGPRAKVGAEAEALRQEHNLILDPSQDEVEGVFLYLDDGRVTSQSPRGQVTIDILGLNRSNLVRARQHNVLRLQALLEPSMSSSTGRLPGNLIEQLRGLTAPKMSFCALNRQFIQAWAQSMVERQPAMHKQLSTFLDFTTALGASSPSDNDQLLSSASEELTQRTKEFESFSVEQAQAPEQLYRVSQYIERITLDNIRTVEHLELQPKPNAELVGSWFMLLGENGSGKSTLLQAVA